MGFGNIGIGELMVILLAVMVIFGPKRLPEIARNMGKFMRDFRRETNAAIKELKEGIEPVRVGIFDEPDAVTTAAVTNGETTPMPGAAAAGGAGTAPAPTRPIAYQEGNGARKASAKAKPSAGSTAKRKRATPAAKRKAAATTSKKRTTPKTAKTAKRPATRAGAARKR